MCKKISHRQTKDRALFKVEEMELFMHKALNNIQVQYKSTTLQVKEQGCNRAMRMV